MIESILGISTFVFAFVMVFLFGAEFIRIRSFFRKQDVEDKVSDGTEEVLWDVETLQ